MSELVQIFIQRFIFYTQYICICKFYTYLPRCKRDFDLTINISYVGIRHTDIWLSIYQFLP